VTAHNTIVDHANVVLHGVNGCRFEKVKQATPEQEANLKLSHVD